MKKPFIKLTVTGLTLSVVTHSQILSEPWRLSTSQVRIGLFFASKFCQPIPQLSQYVELLLVQYNLTVRIL